MNTVKIQKGNVQMIAHRGVSGLETENTAAAFVAAGNRSYWGIETDVHRTLDGEMIIIHDDNTGRVCNEDVIVEESNYADLRELMLRDIDKTTYRHDLRLPSLKEYIRICKKYEKIAVLELKNAFEKADIEKIVAEIREEEYLEQVQFISFCKENLIYLREIVPDQPAQQLVRYMNEEWFELIKQHHLDLDVYYGELTEEWIKRLHEAGIKVNCWTVNKQEDAERLAAWGVDQITTNILE